MPGEVVQAGCSGLGFSVVPSIWPHSVISARFSCLFLPGAYQGAYLVSDRSVLHSLLGFWPRYNSILLSQLHSCMCCLTGGGNKKQNWRHSKRC